MKRIAWLLMVALLATSMATAREQRAKEELLSTDKAWSAAASAGKDVEAVVSFWSDNAVVVPPGAPAIVGKDAIRKFVAQSFETPGFHISWKTLNAAVSDDGTMGYLESENSIQMPGPDGNPVTRTGRAITVWRRGPDGSWKCVYDSWNYGP